jgi:hypothetical protein
MPARAYCLETISPVSALTPSPIAAYVRRLRCGECVAAAQWQRERHSRTLNTIAAGDAPRKFVIYHRAGEERVGRADCRRVGGATKFE